MHNWLDPYGRDRQRGTVRTLARQANADAERMRKERESMAGDGSRGQAMTTTITDKQRDILRHALGVGRGQIDRWGKQRSAGWRNHFVTGPGSDDYADCEALVAAGLMTKRGGGPLSGGDPVYRVTDAGEEVLVGRKMSVGARGS
jgi:hypothetical protein